MDVERSPRADLVAARATGVGVGFITFMIAWLIGARLLERIWGQPSAAYVALPTHLSCDLRPDRSAPAARCARAGAD